MLQGVVDATSTAMAESVGCIIECETFHAAERTRAARSAHALFLGFHLFHPGALFLMLHYCACRFDGETVALFQV